MAPSPVSGMKIKNLLVGVIIGLLAAVHSTPVSTGIFTKPDSDVLQEAMKDEFLIPSLTTQISKRNANTHTVQQPSSDFKKSEMIESTSDGDNNDHYTPTFQDVSKTQSSTSAVSTHGTGDGSDQSTTQSTPSTKEGITFKTFDSGHGEMVDQYTTTMFSMTSIPRKEDTVSLSTTMIPTVAREIKESGSRMEEAKAPSFMSSPTPLTTRPKESDAEPGSGMSEDSTTAAKTTPRNILTSAHIHGEKPDQYPATVSNSLQKKARAPLLTSSPPTVTTESQESDAEPGSGMSEDSTTTAKSATYNTRTLSSSTSTALKPDLTTATEVTEVIEVNSVQGNRAVNHEPRQDKGQSTPGWIIILVCVVGVAALVIVCVAVTTKEKWYGPSQVSQPETKTNQQRELEIETFLHKDKPRENRNSAEYTIVALDELPRS